MIDWTVSEEEIQAVESLLLNKGCSFADDAKQVIRYWNSTDVSACPGCGKTTVLLAKLKIIADRMPLENGAGICVLSHTNVAVDDIKSKLAAYAERLMGYPNYVGTIQTFIDRYITFPYLRSFTKESLQVVDDRTFAQHLWTSATSDRSFGTFCWLVRQRYQQSKDHIADIIDYVRELSLKNGDLHHKSQIARLAGSTTPSAQQYAAAKQELLKNLGLITYSDAYRYAVEAVNNRPELKGLLSRRFRLVFIDEFQDCSKEQRDILEMVFDKNTCSIMRIGDPDQAIYNSDREKTDDWVPENNALTIASSNRYSQEIADILTPLRTDKVHITSLRGAMGIHPTIIIFNEESRQKVIGAFISLLEKHQITDPDGTYKIVGWVKSETTKGLKIGDYWDGYQADTGALAETKYWSMIDAMRDELRKGRIYKVEAILRKLLVRILKYHECKDVDGKSFTYISVKKKLDDKYFDIYRGALLCMANLSDYSRDAIDQAVRITINTMLGSDCNPVDAFIGLPPYFMEDGKAARTRSDSRNYFHDPIRGRKIQVSTIHKVKGETHDATLYLETVNTRKSDLERVIPHYKGTTPGTAQLDQYSRKCVYVGFSRPRKLLCIAMRASTYEGAWKNFSGWEVYDCRDNR